MKHSEQMKRQVFAAGTIDLLEKINVNIESAGPILTGPEVLDISIKFATLYKAVALVGKKP